VYHNEERIRSYYAQQRPLVVGISRETTETREASGGLNVLGIVSAGGKRGKEVKTTAHEVLHPEQMLDAIIDHGCKHGSLRVLRDERDFSAVTRGTLVLFHGVMAVSCDSRDDDRLVKGPLKGPAKLAGTIGRQPVEVHFSMERIPMSNQPSLGYQEEWEGLAVFMGESTERVAVLVPLAFGVGFLGDEHEAST
jgi:hypothetical protein